MKNTMTKKLSCILLALVCSLTCMILPGVDASAKVQKPGKSAITSVTRLNKTSLKINWKKVNGAKAYEVYMKTNSGGFKKIKTTSSRTMTKAGLRINSTYCFKVRAYKSYKGKKYYGAFSMLKKYKMNSFSFLDSIEPVLMKQYTGNMGDSFIYKIGKHEYTRGNIDIDGNEYVHGLEAWIARWNYDEEISWAYSIFNINRKYKKLQGRTVLIDSYNTTNFDTTLYFYGDGVLLEEYRITPKHAKINFNIDVTDVKLLKVYVKDNVAVCGGTSFGLINCKLYY